MEVVSYLFLSTERHQSANGLGVEAQHATRGVCPRGTFVMVKEYVEVNRAAAAAAYPLGSRRSTTRR